MSDYGFKISREGIDVNIAADEDLVISSKFDNFVVVQEAGGTAPAGAGDQTITITNTLDFPTVFYVWEKAGYKTNSWRCNYKSYIDAADSMKLKLVIPASVEYYYMITNKRLDSTPTTLKPTGSDYGMKISTAGADVNNATWDQISFISSKRNLQVIDAVSWGYQYDWSMSTDGYAQDPGVYYEYSIAHGLSYIPLFRDVIAGLHSNSSSVPAYVAQGIGPSELNVDLFTGEGYNNFIAEICVDATHFYLRYKSAEGLTVYNMGFDIYGLSEAKATAWIIGGKP